MNGDSTVLLIVWIVGLWFLVYSAVRLAVDGALAAERPRLVADAVTTATDVRFAVANTGTGPAYDLSVRWAGKAAGEPLAMTVLLLANSRLEWTLPLGPVDDRPQSVRMLRVDFSNGPGLGRSFRTVPVVVPASFVEFR
jgi:hypothetical protein